MKRILITGANSYIGTSVEKYLLQWPDEYQVDTIDMIDGSWREKSFAGYDSVFHVAGIAHQDSGKITEERKKLYYQVNTDLAIETAKKAKADGVKQFIFMSSIIVYGVSAKMGEKKVITRDTVPAPAGAYGGSKLQAELGIQPLHDENSFKVCILRPPMIYGPGCKGNYPLLEKAALRLPFFPDIQNERSMLHIDGLCAFFKSAIDQCIGGVCFPQDPQYVCTSQMVKDIALTHGRTICLTRVFNPLLRLLSGRVVVVDKVFGSLIYETKKHDDYIPDLVSVIMPAYNSAKYIKESIKSVLNQTYKLIELIIVDDCSADKTVELIENARKTDNRIYLFKQESNFGTGAARNLAVENARGEFIAFLDSDDLWEPEKLEKQVGYMKKYHASFTCTDYVIINAKGELTGEHCHAVPVSNYETLLKCCPGNSTVVYQVSKLGKVFIPPIRKRNDYVMWLSVIKKSGELIGIPEQLTRYRVHDGGISHNKFSLIKYHYIIYRTIEQLPMWKTVWLIAFWGLKTVKKQLVLKRNL